MSCIFHLAIYQESSVMGFWSPQIIRNQGPMGVIFTEHLAIAWWLVHESFTISICRVYHGSQPESLGSFRWEETLFRPELSRQLHLIGVDLKILGPFPFPIGDTLRSQLIFKIYIAVSWLQLIHPHFKCKAVTEGEKMRNGSVGAICILEHSDE